MCHFRSPFTFTPIVSRQLDVDNDGVLDDNELQAFARTCNGGREFNHVELEEIRDCLDCDDNGRLLLEGFKQMFHLQVQ
jgi:hypothetical protein